MGSTRVKARTLVGVLVALTIGMGLAKAQEGGPLTIAKQGYLFAGGQ